MAKDEQERQTALRYKSIGVWLKQFWNRLRRQSLEPLPQKRVAIVGNPNVGKSLVFNRLTGIYITVSNYPGTTVEVFRGRTYIGETLYEIVDTPGMYSLLPSSEEESVARRLLLEWHSDVVVHVVDAKNLGRMLSLTIQLVEAGFSIVLALNMMDEAENMGLHIDTEKLSELLGVPVVPVIATKGQGIAELRRVIHATASRQTDSTLRYDPRLEEALANIEKRLQADYSVSKRTIALFLLQGDSEIEMLVKEKESSNSLNAIRSIVREMRVNGQHSPTYRIAMARQRFAEAVVERVVNYTPTRPRTFSDKLSNLMIHPLWGSLLLLLLLYFGFYQFVGVFAAGTAVEFLEDTVFGNHILPPIVRFFEWLIPFAWLRHLFVGEYGIFTLGLRYALALLLPIVTAFFLVFSLVEDSGYFPRLALLVDRLFKGIGLSGRAVIPMVLGFGCDTMATMVTRILPTKRERLIATLLLALAVPCSAQLGIMMATVSNVKGGILVWMLFVSAAFLLVGYLSAKLMPGKSPRFYIEVVPLRLPSLENVLVKTWTRLQWYLLEVTPLFVVASILIWLGKLTHLFDLAIAALSHPVQWIGLQKEMATVILFGFFRRDYGAAGLLDMMERGAVSGSDLIVTAIVLTLFVPCIANFLMIAREHGWRTAFGMVSFIFPFAFFSGWVAKHLLSWLQQLRIVTG